MHPSVKGAYWFVEGDYKGNDKSGFAADNLAGKAAIREMSATKNP